MRTNYAYTFLFANDVHCQGDAARYNAIKQTVKGMNRIEQYGIPRPFGVFVNGDLTNWGGGYEFLGTGAQLIEFRNLFETGRTGDSLNYPIFPGLGNHDLDPNGTIPFDNSYRNQMWAYIHSFRFSRPVIMDQLGSEDNLIVSHAPPGSYDQLVWGLHSNDYMLELPEIAFVQMHRFGGDTRYGHKSGLGWLAGELGRIGPQKRICLFQHYGWDSFSTNDPQNVWWTDQERQALLDVVKNYNVSGLFHGHIHTPPPQDYTVPGINFRMHSPGSVFENRFGIATVTDTSLTVRYAQVTDANGTLNLTSPMSTMPVTPSSQTI